jgi:outer membrane protein assembly factor BamA
VALAAAALVAASGAAHAGQATRQPPLLRHVAVDGVSVYSRDDVLWLLDLREGSALVRPPEAVAAALQARYARDGYTKAHVSAAFDAGVLTLHVDEGRLDAVELRGLRSAQADRVNAQLGIRAGDIYNVRTVGAALDRLVAASGGALTHEEATVEERQGRRVLVVPLSWRIARTSITTGQDREDLFSPVDGFNPAIGFSTTLYDHGRLNHTAISGFVGYKFAREDAGYSLGAERPLFGSPKLFLGGELHDVTASDDWWRLTIPEQLVASAGFSNTFRDYYQRKGGQLFSTLQAGRHNELELMLRWDRHAPLPNTSDFSLFRDATFRPNLAAIDQRVNAWIIGYRFDTRPLTGAGDATTYRRHLTDDLYGFGINREPGLRVEWTSEIAHGLGGDARFVRDILDTRGYLSFSPRQLLSARGVVGGSSGTLPPERAFAIGGIGSVHGYAFKEATGTGMALVNAEYRVDLTRPRYPEGALLSVLGFYDAGRVFGPVGGSRHDWLQGVGIGVASGSWFRIDFGFRADDIPSSRQILVRIGPTF